MGQIKPKCQLCEMEWHREHLFDHCIVVEGWENKIYGVIGKYGNYKNNKRMNRKDSFMDSSSEITHLVGYIIGVFGKPIGI